MSEIDPLSTSLRTLTQFMIGRESMQETLDRVADLAMHAVSPTTHVGITMLDESGRVRTTVFTDPETPEIDRAQYDAGTGPCVDCFHSGEVQRVDDTHDELRWPEFCASAAGHGVRSVLSLPATVEGATLGAFNLYADTPRAFGEHEAGIADLFCEQAAIVLANSSSYWDTRDRAVQLEEAMRSRATIEQAKGIIMATTRCTPDEAFQLLVRQSQHENRKLHEVAAEVVTRTTGPAAG